jgi:hypothetical protein
MLAIFRLLLQIGNLSLHLFTGFLTGGGQAAVLLIPFVLEMLMPHLFGTRLGGLLPGCQQAHLRPHII